MSKVKVKIKVKDKLKLLGVNVKVKVARFMIQHFQKVLLFTRISYIVLFGIHSKQFFSVKGV